MRWWAEKRVNTLQDIARADGAGWSTFEELGRLRRTSVSPHLYARVVRSIPWQALPTPTHQIGQWVAAKESNGSIGTIYHIQNVTPLKAKSYKKDGFEQLHLVAQNQMVPNSLMREVRVLRCMSAKRVVLDYNPQEDIEPEQTLWLWGNDWIHNLAWDPREWQWRRLGTLPDTSVLNYSTKRGYRIALKLNTQPMTLDKELEGEGFNSKARARFFNRIWHPYLPRKVSTMQWLVLTEGLPVGAWRERIGMPSDCELCSTPTKETIEHALKDCPHLSKAWELFRDTRRAAKLPPAYNSWTEISIGLMRDPPGPQMEEELRWDTATAFSINSDTPWDILRAQLLWSIWCQRVAHTFRDENLHLGVVLWHAWRNTIYCAMEAYKELFRHKRNEEKRQQLIQCFQQIWTAENIFGRMQGNTIKWSITPPQEFLPKELGAWTVPPIRINRLSPSPDPEAEFVARPDFRTLVDEFVQSIGRSWRPPPADTTEDEAQRTTPNAMSRQQSPQPLGEQTQQEDLCTTTPIETEFSESTHREHTAEDTRQFPSESINQNTPPPKEQLPGTDQLNARTEEESNTSVRFSLEQYDLSTKQAETKMLQTA